jgi:hypothetical protein
MNRGKKAVSAALGSALFFAGSVVAALTYCWLHNWFGVGDLPAFMFWTAPAAGVTFVLLLLLHRASSRLPSSLLLGLAAAGSLLLGYAWTSTVAAVLGPWIGAFSFPVLYCWTVGFLLAVTMSISVWRKGVLPAAVLTTVALASGLFMTLQWLSTPPPDLIVQLKTGATQDEVNEVWNSVLSHPHSSGVGTWPLDGIQSLSRADTIDGPGIRVGFRARLSRTRRNEIRAIVLGCSIVREVTEIPAVGPGQVRANAKLRDGS